MNIFAVLDTSDAEEDVKPKVTKKKETDEKKQQPSKNASKPQQANKARGAWFPLSQILFSYLHYRYKS